MPPPLSDATIWHSPAAKAWWMETAEEPINRFWLECHPDAIAVTNAREALPPETLRELEVEAAREHALSNCGRCGRLLVVTLYPDFICEFHYCAPAFGCKANA